MDILGKCLILGIRLFNFVCLCYMSGLKFSVEILLVLGNGIVNLILFFLN